jgi:hypothetical protein
VKRYNNREKKNTNIILASVLIIVGVVCSYLVLKDRFGLFQSTESSSQSDSDNEYNDTDSTTSIDLSEISSPEEYLKISYGLEKMKIEFSEKGQYIDISGETYNLESYKKFMQKNQSPTMENGTILFKLNKIEVSDRLLYGKEEDIAFTDPEFNNKDSVYSINWKDGILTGNCAIVYADISIKSEFDKDVLIIAGDIGCDGYIEDSDNISYLLTGSDVSAVWKLEDGVPNAHPTDLIDPNQSLNLSFKKGEEKEYILMYFVKKDFKYYLNDTVSSRLDGDYWIKDQKFMLQVNFFNSNKTLRYDLNNDINKYYEER